MRTLVHIPSTHIRNLAESCAAVGSMLGIEMGISEPTSICLAESVSTTLLQIKEENNLKNTKS